MIKSDENIFCITAKPYGESVGWMDSPHILAALTKPDRSTLLSWIIVNLWCICYSIFSRTEKRRKSRLLPGNSEDGESISKGSELAVYSAPAYPVEVKEETLDSRHPMEVMRRQQHFDNTLDSRRSDRSNYVTVIKIPPFNENPANTTITRLADPTYKGENQEGSVYGYSAPVSSEKAKDLKSQKSNDSKSSKSKDPKLGPRSSDSAMAMRPPAPPPEEAGAVPYPQPYDITASALNMNDGENVYDQIPSSTLSGASQRYIAHAPAANTAAVSLSMPWGDHHHQASGDTQEPSPR